uniref:C-type lectin domain-containing protein n=1 Tax=Oncorhynchus tshawytscha TaxID=74940 RepID=A0AAZ3PMZ4_ONCTS
AILVYISYRAANPSTFSPCQWSGQDGKLFQGSCSMGWYGSNGSCFKYIAMLSQKANLASVHYLDKHYIINNLIKSYDPAESLTWIGLSDIHKSMWMWSDGSQVEFIHWNGEQPDIDQDTEDCVLINWPGGMQWNDLTCSNLLAFVCAKRLN